MSVSALSGHDCAARLAAVGWSAEPLAAALGAELRGPDLTRPQTVDEFAAVEAALLEYEVVFFRGQRGFSPANHAALAAHFGPPQTHPAYPSVEGFPQLTVLENDRENPSLIEKWHTDMTFGAQPPLGSILHGVVVPATGGNTEFLSMSAALAALDPALRERLAALEAEHSFEHGFAESLAAPGGRERLAQALADNPPVVHPVVRTHPASGREALFVNGLFTTRVLGLNPFESEELLRSLYAHMEESRFRCCFAWEKDSVAFWDNRCTQHRPVNDYWPQRRKLQRITIDGDRPFYAARSARVQ